MKLSDSVKPGTLEYRIILQFKRSNNKIKPGKLAELMKIEHSTLNSALERLQKNEIVIWKKYSHVELLEKGRQILGHISNHQHMLKIFLMETLNLKEMDAEKESANLAPHISCNLIDKLCEKYPFCSEHKVHHAFSKQCKI